MVHQKIATNKTPATMASNAIIHISILSFSLIAHLTASAQTAFAELPGWGSDHLAETRPALLAQCGVMPSWQKLCNSAKKLPEADHAAWRAFYEQHFTIEPVDSPALITGYYEPIIQASLTRTDAFPAALHGLPEAAKRQQSRAQIKAEPVESRPVIAWLPSETEAFFTHIQGTALLQIGSQTQRVGYAGDNGQAYHPIGKTLIEQGHLTQANVSMQSIKTWLSTNPQQAQSLMNLNPRYIYFKPIASAANSGPIGAQGIALTAKRSIAVDRTQTPYGTPVFINITLPNGQAFKQLTFAQDTGAAIVGAARADVFIGSGDAAGALAGEMKQTGRIWRLRLK
jgi:membrane-bound lytic murein transglycosylase A